MKFTAIRENHLYQKAYHKGNRFVGQTVAVFVLRDRAAKRLMLAHPQKKYGNRIGLAVTKKLGGAVVRNRAKRVIRAGWQAVERTDGVRTGYLIVLSARPGIVGVKSWQVEQELRYALRRLDMLQGPAVSENTNA
ncbi:MAG: ribonuclease P protein component [Clostridia bacterium]|nr:ribonuclease P protein component [Clostridia bacterium]